MNAWTLRLFLVSDTQTGSLIILVVPLYIIDQCSVKQDLDGPGRALGVNGKPLPIVHHFIFHRSNLIFWIVMGYIVADFDRRVL